MNKKARIMLVHDEGLRLFPYKCTAGKTTIGVGRNIEDRGISKKAAMILLREDIRIATDICIRIFGDQFFGFSENRKLGFINFAFNLGESRMMQFKNTLKAARKEDWEAVEQGLRKSLWFTQVKSRAERVIMMICYEEFPYH